MNIKRIPWRRTTKTRAEDLSSTHIGRAITVSVGDALVTGTLDSIHPIPLPSGNIIVQLMIGCADTARYRRVTTHPDTPVTILSRRHHPTLTVTPKPLPLLSCPACGYRYPPGTVTIDGRVLDPVVEAGGRSNHPTHCYHSEAPREPLIGVVQQLPNPEK